MKLLIDTYHSELARFRCENPNAEKANPQGFATYDETKIKWDGTLENSFSKFETEEFSKQNVRTALYRPFSKTNVYFSRLFNNSVYRIPELFPPEQSFRQPESLSRHYERSEETQNDNKMFRYAQHDGMVTACNNEIAENAPNDDARRVGITAHPTYGLRNEQSSDIAVGKNTHSTTDGLRINEVFSITGRGSTKEFSVLMSNEIPDLEMISKGQCFSRYLYEVETEQNNTTDSTQNARLPQAEYCHHDYDCGNKRLLLPYQRLLARLTPYRRQSMLPTVDLRINKVSCITGLGTTKGFSVLMTDCIPDVQLQINGQAFPQYLYQETTK